MSETPKKRPVIWWTFTPRRGGPIDWWGIDWARSSEEADREEALRKDAEEEAALEAAFRAAHPNLF